MLTKNDAEQFIAGAFTEVWCERKKEAAAKYYHPEFIGLLHGEEEFTYQDVLKRIDYGRERYEKNKLVSYEVFTAENNRIVTRVTMETYDKQEQKQQTIHFMIIINMQDNKMHRMWVLSNLTYRYKAWE